MFMVGSQVRALLGSPELGMIYGRFTACRFHLSTDLLLRVCRSRYLLFVRDATSSEYSLNQRIEAF